MNRFACPVAMGFTISAASLCVSCGGSPSAPSSAPSSSKSGTYMVCYANSSAHGIIVSSVFHLAPVDQVTMLEEPWAKDFRRSVGQSGDAGGISVTCTQVDPKNPETARKEKMDAWRKRGIQVTQVNWKYAGG